MRFATLEGDGITVTFTGENVSDGTLIPGEDPVRIQMDGGGRDFEPVKYATATISCITDGLELLDLYTDSINVRVSVVNDATGKILFHGAVTPNTFAQSITGVNDELSIECVDMLGAAKFIYYEKKGGPEAPFAAMTIAEAVLHMASMLGLQRVWFADSVSVQPRHGEFNTTAYEKLTLAEQYFYSSVTPEPVYKTAGTEITYAPLVMNCHDALSMLAESLYMTFMQVGADLYLHDYAPLRATGKLAYKEIVPSGTGGQSKTSAINVVEESFDEGTVQINVLPRYSLFSVEHKRAEEVSLLPDIYKHELYSVSSGSVSAESSQDVEKRYVKIFGKAITPVVNVNEDLEALMLASLEVKRPDIAKFDSTGAWREREFNRDWKLDFYMLNTYTASTPLFRYLAPYIPAIAARFQWRLRLDIEIGFAPRREIYPAPVSSGVYELEIQIINNGLYYNEVAQNWTSEAHNIVLEFPAGEEWRKSFKFKNASYAVAAADIICFVNEPGAIELRVMGGGNLASALHWITAWIRKLAMLVVEPHHIRQLNELDKLPEKVYAGAWNYDSELDTVSFPIELEPTLAEKSFGTLIDNIEYCGELDLDRPSTTRPAAEFRFLADGQKYTMLQRIEMLANSKDNYELQLSLRDEQNEIVATMAATSPLWNGAKAIVACERDIKNNSITVTVN